jgi:hypothetical protein
MSDTPKHTPGPWEWCETKTGLYGPDYPIIDTDRDWGMFLHPTNLEANARLIAAAPELLEALEALTSNPHVNLGDLVYQVRDREGLGWDGPQVTKWSNAVQQARAAIAKAKP